MSNWHSNPLRVIALMTKTTSEERESLATPILAKDDAIWALMRQNQLMHEENQILRQQLQTLQNENKLLREQKPKHTLLGKRPRDSTTTSETKHTESRQKRKDTHEANSYAQTLLSLATPNAATDVRIQK
jgi:hypothetical protein